MKASDRIIVVVLVLLISGLLHGAPDTKRAMSEKRRWMAAKFDMSDKSADGSKRLEQREAHLLLVGEIKNWWDQPQHNRHYHGKPMAIRGKVYREGLLTHAPRDLVVKLPSRGERFFAKIGLDDKANPAGSAVFSVLTEGKELFKSDVMRVGNAAVPIEVNLGGVTEFVISAGDAGDGFNGDHAMWVDAKVTLRDDTNVFLGDLPLQGAPRREYAEAWPFSFTYGGEPSTGLLKTWPRYHEYSLIVSERDWQERTIKFTDPKTDLEVRCQAIEYLDYPAVEWIVYFRNAGTKDTAVLENVQALDTGLSHDPTRDVVVYHASGSDMGIKDFAPLKTELKAGAKLNIHSRSTSSVESLPFFNVDTSGAGIIGAIGWSGFWSADFVRNQEGAASVQARMPGLRTVLHPGEEIRTPRMLIMFWKGDRIDSHNSWRRLLLDHYSPTPGGKPVVVPFAGSCWGALPVAEHIERVRWYDEKDLPIDTIWVDAGWSGKTGPIQEWPNQAASRKPNPDLFPNGLKPLSDACHEVGMKFLLWTWPNRASPSIGVGKEHPQWLLGGAIDHGNPGANKYIIDEHVELIEQGGIDVYRQDGNPVYPPDSGENRAGIHQIRHFEGFYKFWDTLLSTFPNLLIDNCSGGGRKIDLETIRRIVCLWRSDFQVPIYDPIGMQCQTYGLSFWVPLTAGFARKTDPYTFRSGYGAGMSLGYTDITIHGRHFDYAGTFDYDVGRREMNNYLSVRKYFYGDYYPLTPFSADSADWMVWQFDRPDLGGGVLQAFRRPESSFVAALFELKGLDAAATCTIKDFDKPGSSTATGRELMEEGVRVEIETRPGSVVVTYEKR